MEESHYHHHHRHHHHHHGHDHETSLNDSNSADQEVENVLRTSEQQQIVTQPATGSGLVPKLNKQTSNGVQAASSFHSVSSIGSTAEMSKYFPDAQTPSLSPFRHHQEEEGQQTQSVVTTTPAGTNASTVNAGPYITVPAPTAVPQPLPQPIRAPIIIPRQQQLVQAPAAAPKILPGIPSYPSQIEGLSVSQTVVNDVLIDLQTKVINETHQQYHSDSSSGNYLEQLSTIYIRAPNPSIILRSDLHRLRTQLNARPPGHRIGGINQFQQNRFQVPSFPPPPQQQHLPPGCYGQY